MDTPLDIHSYARQSYETIYQSGEFVFESQKTIVARSLFIAYKLTDQDGMFRERKISYRERSTLAPASDQDVVRIFAALEEFSTFEATEDLIGNGGKDMGQAATEKTKDVIPPLSKTRMQLAQTPVSMNQLINF